MSIKCGVMYALNYEYPNMNDDETKKIILNTQIQIPL